jgi:cytochrome b
MRSFYAAGAPPTVRVAAVVQALEAVALCAAAVAQLVEAASGRSYQASSAVGLAVTELIAVALIAGIASGIARVRPWSRTPAVMTQLGCGLVAIILLQAHRAAWGLPPLILAVAGLAALFSPASLKALSRR